MKSLPNYSLKANSLVESIVAMTIVAICLSIAFMVFVQVYATQPSLKDYKTEQDAKRQYWYENHGVEDLLKDIDMIQVSNIEVHELEWQNGLSLLEISSKDSLQNRKVYRYVIEKE